MKAYRDTHHTHPQQVIKTDMSNRNNQRNMVVFFHLLQGITYYVLRAFSSFLLIS